MKKPQVKKSKKKQPVVNSPNGKSDHLIRKIKRLEKIDKNFLWHPFTQMQDWVQQKLTIIETAKGVYLTDLSGKKYLDGSASLWVNLHGHRRKELDQAIKQQLNKVAHSTLLGLSNIPAIELAKELIHISPKGLRRVFYSDNGSTAIEIALKMAHQFWKLQTPSHSGKNSFLSFTNAYHGDTIGSVSIGGIDLFHQRFNPLLFKTFRVRSPYCYRCHLNLDFPSCNLICTEEVEKLFEKHHHEIAAAVIEPKVQAAAGMLTAPKGYLKKIRQLCDRYQVLLITDEVATGFGRTGKMFACQEDQVTPDLLALSKGITGGYLPLAATLTTEKIYQAFLGSYEEFKTFYHGHSYTGNPIGCAVALANLQIFKKDHLLKVVREKASFLKKLLIPIKNLPHVGDIRQAGLMVGIELVKNKATKEPYPLSEKIGMQICEEVKKRGMILRPLGNIIVLMPPLITTHKELFKMVRIIQDSIQVTTNP